jgi:hypothetical protein
MLRLLGFNVPSAGVQLTDMSTEQEQPFSVLFRASQRAYTTTVLLSAAAFGIGALAQRDWAVRNAIPWLGSLFLLGGLWTVYWTRASRSKWIKTSVYLALAVLIFCRVVNRHDLGPNDSAEDLCWVNFKQQLFKDPDFWGVRVRYFRHVYWVEGSLKSEADLERLIALARQCGIEERRLDGPYVHSVSITIPGTERANAHH